MEHLPYNIPSTSLGWDPLFEIAQWWVRQDLKKEIDTDQRLTPTVLNRRGFEDSPLNGDRLCVYCHPRIFDKITIRVVKDLHRLVRTTLKLEMIEISRSHPLRDECYGTAPWAWTCRSARTGFGRVVGSSCGISGRG